MPIRSSDGKTVVSLFADGLELKFVRLSLKGNNIILRDCKTVALNKKIDEKQALGGDDVSMDEISMTDSFVTPSAELTGKRIVNRTLLFS